MFFLVYIILGIFFGAYIKYTGNFLLLIPFIVLIILLRIRDKKRFYLAFISLFITFMIARFEYNVQSNIQERAMIIEKKENYCILRFKKYKLICYDLDELNLYSIVYIEGTTEELEVKRSSHVSSFNDYLQKKGIRYSIKLNNYQKINNGDVVRPKIINYLISDVSDESRSMIKMLVLGDNSDEGIFYHDLVNLSIVHLFVISGFHLNILSYLINKILRKEKDSIFTVIFLIPYCYILNFTIPIMRAFICKVIKLTNEKFNLYLDDFSILSITCLLFLLVNYRMVFNLSFQLTFITNYILVFFQQIKVEDKIKKYIVLPLFIYLAIIPIINNINYQLSLFGFLFASLVSPFVVALYISCFLTAIFKIFDPLNRGLILVAKKIISLISSTNKVLIFGKMSVTFIFVYYLIFIFLLFFISIRKKNTYRLLFASMFMLLGYQYFKLDIFGQAKTIFIDVGQGDSTLIVGKNNKYNILIDTGGSVYSDVATRKLIPLLKSSGIRKLDYIFITHDDYDHCGALDTLKNDFRVDNIIYGEDFTSYSVGDLKLENLNIYSSYESDDNSKSAVIKYNQNGHEFLIMGDAPINIEKKICNDNSDLDVDILRIGHHGSKTSTSDELLMNVLPKVAIISVGKNYYGHPHKEVIEKLKEFNIPYYRTDYFGSICINKRGIIINY